MTEIPTISLPKKILLGTEKALNVCSVPPGNERDRVRTIYLHIRQILSLLRVSDGALQIDQDPSEAVDLYDLFGGARRVITFTEKKMWEVSDNVDGITSWTEIASDTDGSSLFILYDAMSVFSMLSISYCEAAQGLEGELRESILSHAFTFDLVSRISSECVSEWETLDLATSKAGRQNQVSIQKNQVAA